jgi:hypothetical protein
MPPKENPAQYLLIPTLSNNITGAQAGGMGATQVPFTFRALQMYGNRLRKTMQLICLLPS